MATTHITGVLNDEKAILDAFLAAATPPAGMRLARINKTLDFIAYARQRSSESEADYFQRVDDLIQRAPAGVWTQSFWSQFEAAYQSDTGGTPAGGVGRNKDV